MASQSITKRTVDAAKPGAKDYFLWDSDVAGFGLKVTPSGSRTFVYQYRLARPGEAAKTSPARITLGKYGRVTPDQARHRAKELAAMILRGIDPRQHERDQIAAEYAADRQAKERARVEGELAFSRYARNFLVQYGEGHRLATVAQARMVVDTYLTPTLGEKPMPKITRRDLVGLIDAIPGNRKATRHQVYQYLSIIWNWAFKRGDVAENPVLAMPKPPAPPSRERVLTDAELADVWKASETLADPFGCFFRLLILTGQRRSEVARMDWAELDRSTATWTIPSNRAKNGLAHVVPLSELVVAELNRLAQGNCWPKAGAVLKTIKGVAINSFSKTKAKLDAAVDGVLGSAPMEPWVVHDLRRTVATGLQRLGVRFEVTEAVLAHISGAKSGVAGIYQHHDWKDEKTQALAAWGAHLSRLVDGSDQDNVTRLCAGEAA